MHSFLYCWDTINDKQQTFQTQYKYNVVPYGGETVVIGSNSVFNWKLGDSESDFGVY